MSFLNDHEQLFRWQWESEIINDSLKLVMCLKDFFPDFKRKFKFNLPLNWQRSQKFQYVP